MLVHELVTDIERGAINYLRRRNLVQTAKTLVVAHGFEMGIHGRVEKVSYLPHLNANIITTPL